jgi:hypothetical protein
MPLAFGDDELQRLFIVLHAITRMRVPTLEGPAEELIFEARGLLANQHLLTQEDYEAWAGEARNLVWQTPRKVRKTIIG